MSADQHPAYSGRRCEATGCGQAAAARVTNPQLPATESGGIGFVIVRPATSPVTIGELLCLDCAHHAVDLMLLGSTPQPATTTEEPGL